MATCLCSAIHYWISLDVIQELAQIRQKADKTLIGLIPLTCRKPFELIYCALGKLICLAWLMWMGTGPASSQRPANLCHVLIAPSGKNFNSPAAQTSHPATPSASLTTFHIREKGTSWIENLFTHPQRAQTKWLKPQQRHWGHLVENPDPFSNDQKSFAHLGVDFQQSHVH